MRVPSARMHALQCVSFVCFGGMSTAGKSTETPLGNIPALKTKVQDNNICSIPEEIQISQINESNQHDKLNEERVQVSKKNSFRKIVQPYNSGAVQPYRKLYNRTIGGLPGIPGVAGGKPK